MAEPHLEYSWRYFKRTKVKGDTTMLILLIVLLVLAFGASPIMPYSRGWGMYPSGGLGLLALIVLIVLLMHGV